MKNTQLIGLRPLLFLLFVIAGANMILVDGPQALLMEELPLFLEFIRNAREAYEKNVGLLASASK